MKHRAFAAAAAAVIGSIGLACAAHASLPYTVTRPASRNLYAAPGVVLIRPFAFHGIINGRPEQQWLQDRTPAQVAAWQQDQAALPQAFLDGMQQGLRELSSTAFQPQISAGAPPAGGLTVDLRGDSVGQGHLDADVVIAANDGAVEQVHFVEPDGGLGTSARLRSGYYNLGLGFARLLHDRSQGGAR